MASSEKDLEAVLFGSKAADTNKSSQGHDTDSTRNPAFKTAAAWQDSDDDMSEGGVDAERPKWAKLRNVKGGKISKLPTSDRKILSEKRASSMKEFGIRPLKSFKNNARFSKRVASIDFQPGTENFMICGRNGEIRIYEIDEKKTTATRKFKLNEGAINAARFSADGWSVFLAGSGDRLLQLSLDDGRVAGAKRSTGRPERQRAVLNVSTDSAAEHKSLFAFAEGSGEVRVCSQASLMEVASFKTGGEVLGLAFSGRSLFTVGEGAEIYEWDLERKVCLERSKQTASVQCTAIAASKCGAYLAVGNDTGHLNLSRDRKLLKIFDNLVTEITGIEFSNTSDFLVYFSSAKGNSIRLVNLKTLTVFKSWPSSRVNVGRVAHVKICDNSKYFIVCNTFGSVYIQKIPHYFRN